MTLTSFWPLVAWVLGAGGFFTLLNKKMNNGPERTFDDSNQKIYFGIISCLIIIIPLIIWTGYRPKFYGDTWAYYENFKNFKVGYEQIKTILDSNGKDKLFYAMQCVFKSIFPNSTPRIWFTVLASFQLLTVLYILRKYSENFVLSIIIFVFSLNYTGFMWNGSRQFTAVCIVLLATPLIEKKKFLSAILVIIFASQFHQSALIMIPIIFIISGKAWNRKTIITILIAVSLVFFLENFTSFLDDALQETQYKNVVSDYQELQDDGSNPLRVMFFSIPAIISLIFKRRLKFEDTPFISLCVNASILSTALWIVSMLTSGVYIGRLPIYVSIYANEILLPWEINHLFSKKLRPLVYILTIVVYFLFFYYEMHFNQGRL